MPTSELCPDRSGLAPRALEPTVTSATANQDTKRALMEGTPSLHRVPSRARLVSDWRRFSVHSCQASQTPRAPMPRLARGCPPRLFDGAGVDRVQPAPQGGYVLVRDVVQHGHRALGEALDLLVEARVLAQIGDRQRWYAPVRLHVTEKVGSALGAVAAQAMTRLTMLQVERPAALIG